MGIEASASDSGWLLEPSRGPRPFRKGDFAMDSWEIVRRIGKGGYGTVFEVRKNMMNASFDSAMKVIAIPQEEDYAESQRSLGFSDRQITASIRNQVELAAMEIRAMISLSAHPAVVRIEDFSAVQYEDTGSWEIFIRMELLTSLTEWVRKNRVSQETVRQIGMTIADLLRYGESRHVLHHDIKPDNLFMNSLDMCKLGDFGLVRTLDAGASTRTRGAGTDAFIAPEVARREPYDVRSDVYSLGLVLYWLLNGQRMPFADAESYEKAIGRRLRGQAIPAVPGIDERLMRAVLRACAFRPEDRFAGGEALRDALRSMGSMPQTSVGGARREPPPGEKPHAEPSSGAAEKPQSAETDFDYRYDPGTGVTITRYRGAGGAVTIPAMLGGRRVRVIGSSAFADCTTVRSVVFPNGLAAIGDFAFYRSGLQRVAIPQTVTSLGRGVFDNCVSLTMAVLPMGLTSITSSAFNACTALREIAIPPTVNSIGTYAFANSGLEEVTVPSAAARIDNRAFFGCQRLRKVTLKSGVRQIGSYAFSRCSALTDLTIPASVADIGVRAFHGCRALDVAVADNAYAEGVCRQNGVRWHRVHAE